MLCAIRRPDGTPFPLDTRALLKTALHQAASEGVRLNVGTEFEFYLFKTDAAGNPTREPLDNGGYMDVSPEDQGENVRREICLMLSQMGLHPESSHHEEGPSQHEIDFRFGEALEAADNAVLFPTVVRTCAMRNGLFADFSPKPLEGESGSGLHINLSLASNAAEAATAAFMAGILAHAPEITAFLNPLPVSYRRLGEKKAPKFVTWSPENRSPLIRIPAAQGDYRRMELRSPDPAVNPYLALLLVLKAGLDGIHQGLTPPPPVNLNLYTAEKAALAGLTPLPATPEAAVRLMEQSELVRQSLPQEISAAFKTRLLS